MIIYILLNKNMILLYGYYNYNNFGDELFKFILIKYLNNKKFEYIISNPKHINKEYKNLQKVDLILLGGGEIINDFFILPLLNYIKYHNIYNIPICGVSIGYDNNLPIKYLDFIDKCIFRNNVSIIDDINYYYDNDIVFYLKNYINISTSKNKIPYTIGYYLIDNIEYNLYNTLIKFTNSLPNNYKINFIVFDNKKDHHIINKFILDSNLCNDRYEIIIKTNPLDIINEISKNSKHLCMRFHAHIICYILKVQFISFPLTNKTRLFNEYHNINYSFDIDKLLYLLDNQNIIFKDINFNIEKLDNIIESLLLPNKLETKNKLLTIWGVYNEIYSNFLKLILNKNKIYNIDYYINYIIDQIELNILKKLYTEYRYGLKDKLFKLYHDFDNLSYELQNNFIKILTDLQ